MTAPAAGICVLLPVRNGERHVAVAIESVLAQTATDVTLVVSDNHSTDATPGILAAYAQNPRVEIVRPPEPLGMMAHFNRCLSLARGRYHAVLCHDDYFESPRALELARDALDANPDVAAAYGDMRYVDEDGRAIAVRRFGRPEGRVDADRLARASVRSNRNLFGIPVLVRTAALGDLRYDATLPYSSDLELSIALSKGGDVVHLDEVLVANRFHGGNASIALFRRAAAELDVIAARHGIRLGALDRAARRAAIVGSSVQKWAFFRWLELRARIAPGRRAA